MKKIIACLLVFFGLTSAYGQKSYEDVDVKEFAELVADSSVVVLDVRTAEEFAEGHINLKGGILAWIDEKMPVSKE